MTSKSTTTIRRTAILAMAAAIGLAGLAPAAQAADNARGPGRDIRPHQGMAHGGPGAMSAPGGSAPLAGLLAIACSPQGAERIDATFLRLSYRLSLTAAQQPLFDDLRASALAAQKGFAEDCATIRPAEADRAAADPLDRLRSRLDLASARIDAVETLLPKAEAFYDALDDSQKASLAAPREHRGELRREDRRERMERWTNRRDAEHGARRGPMPPSGQRS